MFIVCDVINYPISWRRLQLRLYPTNARVFSQLYPLAGVKMIHHFLCRDNRGPTRERRPLQYFKSEFQTGMTDLRRRSHVISGKAAFFDEIVILLLNSA
jgi:hypothetical protein